MNYTEQQVREQLARGPYKSDEFDGHADTFYRVKVRGDGETKWLNVGAAAVEALAAAVSDDPSPLQRIANMLAEPNWSVGMLEDIAAIVKRAGVEPRADREPYYHH